VCVRKPVGETSFQVVKRFQERLAATPGRALKVCHGGALDPFAEGLLLVLVGSATRLFEWLHEVPKTYRVRVAWGQETDTLDPAGQVVREGPPPAREAVEQALAEFRGWTEQVPPATSNKRVKGERAYALAHRGEEVVLPASRVFLHEARWLTNEGVPTELELTCRGGFYVRSLVRDLARRVGSAAHVAALERTRIGPWTCPKPEEETVVRGEGLMPWWPMRVLSDDEWGQARAGQTLTPGRLVPATWSVPEGFPPPTPLVRAVHLGRFVAVLESKAGGWVVKAELPGGL
jgi:tRNA pseudouridine55 synthase